LGHVILLLYRWMSMCLSKKNFPINSLCPSCDEQRSYLAAAAIAATAFTTFAFAAFVVEDR
jgi:hypothetical protein